MNLPTLCDSCRWLRQIVTPKGSRFLLCERSKADADYPKYPRQPVVRCGGYQPGERVEQEPR